MPIDTIETHRQFYGATEVRAVGGKDGRRVSISVSSENSVDRYYGDEILSHERSAIDLSFFGSGNAPLLLDHDPTKQIGVVESVTLDEQEKKLRAVVRFGNSALASEVYDDVLNGIRRNTSVGYRIKKHEPLPNDEGIRVILWEPKEVSFVSIPADPTVGKGRSALSGDPGPSANPDDHTNRKGDEMSATDEMRDLYARHDQLHRYPAAVARGLTPDQMRQDVLAHLPNDVPMEDGRDDYFPAPAYNRGGHQPSLLNAINSVATSNPRAASLEYERSAELAERYGVRASGILWSPEDLVPMRTRAALMRAAQTSTDFSGQMPVNLMDGMFIPALQAHARVLELGATVVQSAADFDVPFWPTPPRPQWVGEGEAPVDDDLSADAIGMRYHQLSASMNVTRRVSKQGLPQVEELYRQEAIRAKAVALDAAAINGNGTGAMPRGVLNTTGIGNVALGENGGALTWGDVVALPTAVLSEDVPDNAPGFLGSYAAMRTLMTTERATGTARFLMDDATPDRLAGYPAAFTSNVPSNGTKGTGTGLSTLIFGNWRDLLIAQFGPIDVIIDPYSESSRGNVRVSLHSAWDIAVRYPQSFAAITDIVTD